MGLHADGDRGAKREGGRSRLLEEGLEWTFTHYPDNAARLELFEKKNRLEYMNRFTVSNTDAQGLLETVVFFFGAKYTE